MDEMRNQVARLVACAVLLVSPAAAQNADAMSRWGQKTGDALIRFLPNATRWNLSADAAPIFSAFANETYEYKGANSLVHKYPSYVVHQTWWFNDAELSRQMSDLDKEKAALNAQFDKDTADFERLHGSEMQAAQKAHQDEMNALATQIAQLSTQGKYAEAQPLVQKLEKLGPYVYPPYQSMTESYKKHQEQLTERERELTNQRRQVNFRIYTNRTPATTAPKFAPKPAGTLAGHPFFRQDEGSVNTGDPNGRLVDLAVFVGPPGYENPRVKIGNKELAVKCMVVWAWIQSHNTMIQADEATVKKVLESMDYEGLSKLLVP